MSISEKPLPAIEENAPEALQVYIGMFFADLYGRRRLVAWVTAAGALLAIAVSLLIPNEYTSTTQLMPPDQQSITNMSTLSALSGLGAISLASPGGLMSQRTPGETSIGILSSRTATDAIIDRFDLRKVYHCKLYTDARKTLAKRAVFAENKKSGIISISVTDREPKRARDMAAAYVEELSLLLNTLSTSSARRERVFLEDRIKSVKQDLDTSSTSLSLFSSHNAMLDPQRQGEATMTEAGRLQSELMQAQAQLAALRTTYTDEEAHVHDLKARINELEQQLRKISGSGQIADTTNLKEDQSFPSFRKLPLLGVRYYDLLRQVTMEEALYETLSKQYEMAKVQEAKDLPPVKVLDQADVPERKSAPHRAILVIFCTLFSALLGVAWIFAGTLRHLLRAWRQSLAEPT